MAVSSLRALTDNAAERAIIAATADSEESVRTAAARTIPFRPFEGLRPSMENLLKTDPSVVVRMAVIDGLKKPMNDDPSIVSLLESTRPDDRSVAVCLNCAGAGSAPVEVHSTEIRPLDVLCSGLHGRPRSQEDLESQGEPRCAHDPFADSQASAHRQTDQGRGPEREGLVEVGFQIQGEPGALHPGHAEAPPGGFGGRFLDAARTPSTCPSSRAASCWR